MVVPVTLLEQWRRELAAWAAVSAGDFWRLHKLLVYLLCVLPSHIEAQNTGLAVHVMHGALPERRAALRGHVHGSGVLIHSTCETKKSATIHNAWLCPFHWLCLSFPLCGKVSAGGVLLISYAHSLLQQPLRLPCAANPKMNAEDLARTCIHQIREYLRPEMPSVSRHPRIFGRYCRLDRS